MKTKLIILLITAVIAITSCKDYLQPYPYGRTTEEDAWKYQEIVAGMVFYAYERGNIIPREYRVSFTGNRLDCTTDDGVYTTTSDNIVKYANGSLLSSSNVWDAIWSDGYKGIASLDNFLDENAGYKKRYYMNLRYDSLYKANLQGMAYSLRGYFYWQLLQRFGGTGMDSKKLLGIPMVLKRPLITDPINIPRADFTKVMAQIQMDADSAFKYFPIEAHRDFLVPNTSDQSILGGRNWSMIDKVATRAYLSEMYLTAASPLYTASDPELASKKLENLEKAARYAKQVIDFKRAVDNVANGFVPTNRVDWRNPVDPSAVWVSRVQGGGTSTNTSHESDVYPAGFNSSGNFGVTQDLVEAFPDENGYPINHPKSVFDPKNPYAKRDKRMSSIVFVNGTKITPNAQPAYTFECWETADDGSVGKDAAGLTKVSRTGYHLKKMVYVDTDMRQSSGRKAAPMQKFTYRWAHMLLMYAEAMNELYGPDVSLPSGDINPLSAKQAIALLRQTKTYDNLAPSIPVADPYLNEVTMQGKDAFRQMIRNERRIETCFEGLRYFDIRRWATSVADINKPVHKVTVNKKLDGTFTYIFDQVVETRNFPSLWTPLPLNDVKRGGLEQNDGWSSWK
jgi:hypothetical protein